MVAKEESRVLTDLEYSLGKVKNREKQRHPFTKNGNKPTAAEMERDIELRQSQRDRHPLPNHKIQRQTVRQTDTLFPTIRYRDRQAPSSQP